uniref:Peptide-O-fucosyltransferase n=1 Tax=Ciona savignyi TaxID=51511 RepID=H2Y5K7_CIOSA
MCRFRNWVLVLINASLFTYYFLIRNTEVLNPDLFKYPTSAQSTNPRLVRLHANFIEGQQTADQNNWKVPQWHESFGELGITQDKTPTAFQNYHGEPGFKETNRKCLKSDTDWSKPITPKHKLDPNRFLIPTLYNGPSNQLAGFQQSALLAIILNRTLVLPNFYEHTYENVLLKTVVGAERRIDLNILRRYMSVIPLSQAVKRCNGRFDVFFNADEEGMSPLLSALPVIHVQTGLQGARYKAGIGIKEVKDFIDRGNMDVYALVNTEIKWLMGDMFQGRKHDFDFMELKSNYQSSKKCAHYFKPFRQLGLRPSDTLPASWPRSAFDIIESPQENVLTKTDAQVFFGDVWRNVNSPKFIRDVAHAFRNEILGPSHVAVHWRYDKEDFLHYLCDVHFRPKIAEMCQLIERAANASAFAHALAVKLLEAREIHGYNPKSVYLAAPSSVTGFVNSIQVAFSKLLRGIPKYRDLGKVEIFYSKDLFNFVLKNYRICGSTSSDFDFTNDVISQVEMEIGKLGKTFLWSKQSTWSQRVVYYRRLQMNSNDLYLDQNILGLIIDTLDGGRGHRRLLREYASTMEQAT